MTQMIFNEHFTLDTQRYRPTVLFINGEYFGIHNIRDKYNELHLAAKYDINPSDIDLLNISDLPPIVFSDMTVRDKSYYQGTLLIGEKDY